MKNILGTYQAPRPHWVGDGFPVRSLFSYSSHGKHLSPFLLLDYAGPATFDPTDRPRGVGQHPHRGFETVTIVYEGEVDHRDSTGAGGHIGPGDVQWMTAAGGILHEEFHSDDFTKNGGTLEMVQLWVNLPAKYKMDKPGYQTLLNADIPSVPLANDSGYARIIAGDLGQYHGPARTYTPINLWDIRLKQGKAHTFHVPEGHNLALVILRGQVRVNGGDAIAQAQWVHLGQEGTSLHLEASSDATVLLLSGEPIDEPIVGHGPFVMNTEAEIRQAFYDVSLGNFGKLDH